MALTVADVMTSPVFSLGPSATLQDAHAVTREKGIRHLPIIDPSTNKLLGIVTQKVLIARVIALLSEVGNEGLAREESKVKITDLMLTDFDSITPTEKAVDVASFFLDNKHGCLPVIDGDSAVVGIVTSSDFVKLVIHLLKDD